MEDDFSSSTFVSGWADSMNFVKNMIAEIFSIKTMSFWKNLDEGKTERGPENGDHSFWAADCLPWPSWSHNSFGNPRMTGIDSKIRPRLITH
jgi:hypothetical protein